MKDRNPNWLELSSIGFQIAASLLLFGWFGNLIDKKLFIDPIGLVLGLVVGGIFSLYQIWKMVSTK